MCNQTTKNDEKVVSEVEKIVMSRRSFLTKTGTIIALGALSNFTILGKLNASTRNISLSRNFANGECLPAGVATYECTNSSTDTDNPCPGGNNKCIYNNADTCVHPSDTCTSADVPPCSKDCVLGFISDLCWLGIGDKDIESQPKH